MALWEVLPVHAEHGRCSQAAASLYSGVCIVLHQCRQVRLGVPDDVVALHALIGSMSNSSELQEAFLHAVGEW